MDEEVRAGAVAVLRGVREGLLDRPVGDHVAGGRQPRDPALVANGDDEARAGEVVDQVGQLLEPGLRDQRCLVVGAQDGQQVAYVPEDPARGALDREECRAGGVALGVQTGQGNGGVQADQRDLVRDDVVQVAGDAEPLLAHAPRRLRLSGRLRVIGPGHDLRDVGAPVADRVGQEIATVSRRTAPATYHPCSRGR